MAFQTPLQCLARGQRFITCSTRFILTDTSNVGLSRACHSSSKELKVPLNMVEEEETQKIKFSPLRSRDTNSARIAAKLSSAGTGPAFGRGPDTNSVCQTFNSSSVPTDTHISVYDQGNTCSLSSVMQTNVPHPFQTHGNVDRSGYLSMPGGQWAQNDKYVSADLHEHHYVNNCSDHPIKGKTRGTVKAVGMNSSIHKSTKTGAAFRAAEVGTKSSKLSTDRVLSSVDMGLGGRTISQLFLKKAIPVFCEINPVCESVYTKTVCNCVKTVSITKKQILRKFGDASLNSRINLFNNYLLNAGSYIRWLSFNATACDFFMKQSFLGYALNIPTYLHTPLSSTNRYTYAHSCHQHNLNFFSLFAGGVPPFTQPCHITNSHHWASHLQQSVGCHSSSKDSTPPGPPLSARQKLQRAVKEYGMTVVVFHVTLSLASLGLCYLLVSSGIDMSGVIERLGIDLMLSTEAPSVASETAPIYDPTTQTSVVTIEQPSSEHLPASPPSGSSSELSIEQLSSEHLPASPPSGSSSELSTAGTVAASLSTFVVAYAVHKVFAPARIAVTLMATPLIVRHLRAKGILKPPKLK